MRHADKEFKFLNPIVSWNSLQDILNHQHVPNHNWVDGKISSPRHETWSPSLNCNLSMEPPECCDITSGGGIKKRHRCLLLNVISGELVVTAVINLRMCRRDQICLTNTPVLSRVNLIWLVAHVVKSVQEKCKLIPSWKYDSEIS